MKDGLARAKAILLVHLGQAEADRIFHQATKPRVQNVDATVAALKASWFSAVIRDIEAEERRAL